MPLTPEEEKQLEYLLRKKYGGDAAESQSAEPTAQVGRGSAKVHGDIIDFEPEN